MPHDRMLATRRTWTWINKYIFPGGFLPSVTAIDEITRADTTLRICDRLSFGQHYARDARALGRRVPRGGRPGPRARLRRDLPADVALLPGVLARRVRVGLHRRAAADLRPGVLMTTTELASDRRLRSRGRGGAPARDRTASLRRRRAAGAAARLGRLRGRPGRRPARGAALARRRTPPALAPGRARGRTGLRHRRHRGPPRPRRRADPRLVGRCRARPDRRTPLAAARSPARCARRSTSARSAGRRALPASQARVRGRLHSKLRDRRAISHHYDLSNEFYSLILDPTMAYSSGYWRSEDPSYTRRRTRSATSSTWSAASSASSRACASSTSAAAGARCPCTPPSTTAPRSPA